MSLKQKCRKYNFKLIGKFKLNAVSIAKWVILLNQKFQSIFEFQKGKKWDLIRKMRSEIGILLNYLPQQLSREKLSVFWESS